MDDGGDAVALRGGGDGRDDPVGAHANGGLAVENGWSGAVLSGLERGGLSWSCFFSLYGCCDRTRVSGAFLRELALGPLMTFGWFDLTVLLHVVRWLVRSVMAVPRSLSALRGQLFMVF